MTTDGAEPIRAKIKESIPEYSYRSDTLSKRTTSGARRFPKGGGQQLAGRPRASPNLSLPTSHSPSHFAYDSGGALPCADP